MKNFKLLLATTAILSTGALMANAGNIATSKFVAHVDIYSAITADPGMIEFNGILAGDGKKVALNSDGTYGAGTTATTIHPKGIVEPAQFKGGPIASDGSNYAKFSGVLTANDENLYDTSDSSIVCGSIDVGEMSVTSEADATYGGIKMTPSGMVFTMADDIETKAAGDGLECMSDITLTLVYDPS